ncbi:MAG TPA: glycosyltransferase [Thermoanaerobaculia bacterium]|nr:glycosyltransferase [Thermoanaerobaculia bacterium]
MRVLHAIHDFLPRHLAGSEIYCLRLCQALQERGIATHVLCAEYDPARPHLALDWRAVEGVGVTEMINNWAFGSFAESYASPALDRRLAQVLDIVQPDVLHVHNLLNLSFRLPALARARGIPTVATLHDYTLVCPSGGQRVHVAEQHLCRTIDTARCARCYAHHPLYAQQVFGGRALARPAGRRLGKLATNVRRRFPALATRLGSAVVSAAPAPLSAADLDERLAAARNVFQDVDLFVSPSPTLADEYRRLGIPAERLLVSDNGFPPLASTSAADAVRAQRARPAPGPLRIGFVGTLVWHKGPHVLLAAAAQLPPGSFEITIHGDTDTFPPYSAELRRAAQGLPVRFAGRFAPEEAAAIFAGFDVLVVPSLWLENSPLVIHEAFQAGVPVVGSRLGGTADLVAHGTSGLLYDAYDASALAAALRRLTDEPALLTHLAANVPAVKSLEADAADWQERYEHVLSRGWDRATAVTSA